MSDLNIFFPTQYKQALQNHTKNITLRIGNEIGKYKISQIYSAVSYSNKPLGVQIKINKIISTTLDQLNLHGIPQKSINSLQCKEKLEPNSPVEIIQFIYV